MTDQASSPSQPLLETRASHTTQSLRKELLISKVLVTEVGNSVKEHKLKAILLWHIS